MRWLFDNLLLKLLSLALSVALWFVIAGAATSEMGLSVPVELRNVPKDLELTGEPVDRVEVRVRGTPGVIQALGPGDVAAQIDLAGAGEGERIVHMGESAIRVPFGVKVVKITPAILTLNLERTVEKAVPVRPRVTGRPAAGYEVAEVASLPEQVKVVGPRSRVREIESAFTEPVSIEGAEATLTEQVALGLEDPLLRVQGASRVKVTARVRPVQERRVFDALPIAVRGGSAAVSPARVRVVLEGPADALERVAEANVRPFVDVTRLRGTSRVIVAVELVPGPPGVSVHHAEPGEVTVVKKR
jgi:YbbR domain-containing protein